MFNRAIEWGCYAPPNPAATIRKFRTHSRDRFIQSDELPRFFQSVMEEPSIDVRDYILLSLLTGARKSNVLTMRWKDVNLDLAVWRMPDTKNGDALSVPLMPEAVDILRHRKPKKAEEFVFPGTGANGHLQGTKRGWRRILDRDELTQLAKRINASGGEFTWPLERIKTDKGDKRLKQETMGEALMRARQAALEMEVDTTGTRLDNLRVHDMRRTLGSWQAATGASLVIIGKSLGHRDLSSTTIYSRLNLDPVRDSMQTATRAMFAAGGLLPKAEVTPIKDAKAKRRRTA
jgi:integrase